MKKAFIFDMDGVLINNEAMWDIEKETIYPEAFGTKIANQLGVTVGSNLETIYKTARKLGSTVPFEKVHEAFAKRAPYVYQSAPLTPELPKLMDELKKNRYAIGLVSASPRDWIDIVLQRLGWLDAFDEIISLFDNKTLAHKPSPDGYIEIMKRLNVSPTRTLILEDSNMGIKSGKAAGATIIGLQQNLVPGYKQQGADFYAEDINSVIEIVKQFNDRLQNEGFAD